MPPWHYVSMGLDLLLLVVLIATRPQADASPGAPIYLRHAVLLYWAGIVAGVVMLLMRFTSDHAWWTGHLQNGV